MMERRSGDVVETYNGNIVRHPQPALLKSTDCTDRGDVVVSEKSGEGPIPFQQLLAVWIAQLRSWIIGVQSNDQLGINIQANFPRYFVYRCPSGICVGALPVTSDTRDTHELQVLQMPTYELDDAALIY